MAGTRHKEASQHDKAGAAERRTPWKWVAAHRLVSGIALATVFLILPLAGMWLLSSPDVEEGPVTLAQLLEALDRGELPRALALADRLSEELDAPEAGEVAAGIAYVRGAAASRQADEAADEN